MTVWKNAAKTMIPLCLYTFSSAAMAELSFEARKMILQKAFTTSEKQDPYYRKSGSSFKEGNSVLREDHLSYQYSAEALSRGHMQMNVSKYDKPKNQAGDKWLYEHQDLDFDRFRDAYGSSDGGGKAYMTLGRSAIIYQNKTPDYFSFNTAMTYEFQEAACNGSEILNIDTLNHTLMTKRSITLIGDMFSLVHFEAYDSLDDFLSDLKVPSGLHHAWKMRASQIKLPLEKITTTWSSKQEIYDSQHKSEYSVGGRTVNFYYNVGGEDTLHISYKIVSFNNVRNLGLIGVHQKTIDSQYVGTFESLKLIRKL